MILAWEGLRGTVAPAARARPAVADVTAVTVTLQRRCRGSSSAWRALRGVETIVVDHGSTDGTLELVRERFPEVRVVEQENRRARRRAERRASARPPRRYYLLINSDAWVVGRRGRAARRLRRRAPRRGGRRRRGSATRTARSSARCAASRRSGGSRPSTSSCASSRRARSALNAFYAGGFDHDEAREVEWAMGAVLPRPPRGGRRGRALRRGVLPVQRGDRLALPLPPRRLEGLVLARGRGRPRRRRDARRADVRRERARRISRFFAKHHGPREAARARRLLRVGARGCAGVLFRGERGPDVPRGAAAARSASRDARARADAPALLALPALGARAARCRSTGCGLWPAARRGDGRACSCPGALVARGAARARASRPRSRGASARSFVATRA